MVKTTQILCAVALVVAASPALAASDPLIEGARQCTQYFPVEEKKNNIPTHLLAAIATTESGRYHNGLKMSVPWPWTVNVEGKGYYFDSKAEAIAQVQAFMEKGYQSIDVGCMQVNLKHHPRAFTDLNQAFDPAKNVAYAATFLRDNYAGLGDWIKATAAYHSRTPVHGQRYLGEIERSWNRIVAKVAAARAGKAGSKSSGEMVVASASPKNPVAGAAIMPKVVGASRQVMPAKRARVIKVNDELRRADEVEVVSQPSTKRTTTEKIIKVADVAVTAAPVMALAAETKAPETLPVGNSVRTVSLDTAAPAPLAQPQASGPNFVFAN